MHARRLDTDVVVAAVRSDLGASRQLILAAAGGRCNLLLSVPLVLEYEAVLTRPTHLKAAKATVGDIDVFLDGLVAMATPVRLSFRWRPVLGDPADDMVLETAINGAADLLVTFNQRHFVGVVRQFQLRVVSPAQALAHLER